MRLEPSAIRPRYDGPPDVAPLEIASAQIVREYLACGAPLTIAASRLSTMSWKQWREAFSDADAGYLLGFFDVSTTTGQSHEGGWPVFEPLACTRCGTAHVLYVGVREVANGAYAIWVQGLARVVAAEQQSGDVAPR